MMRNTDERPSVTDELRSAVPRAQGTPMTMTPVWSSIPAAEDSRAMCFRQGKAWVYASEKDGTIIIAAPPGGVLERLDTGPDRPDQITDSRPTVANANDTGHQPLIPKMTIMIGGNGAGKTTWCRQHPRELPEAFYNPDAIAQELGDWNNARNQLEAGRIVNAAIQRHLEQREDFGFESTYSGRSRPRIVRAAASNGYAVRAVFIGTNGAEINIERVRQRVRSGTRRPAPGDRAAVVSSSEEPCRNGCVARGDRRARQQPRRDQTRRTHHEGRNQATGDANARVGANVDPTDRTAPTDHLTRYPAQRRGVESEPVCGRIAVIERRDGASRGNRPPCGSGASSADRQTG